MVRAISRLQYRRPPVPISFKRIDAADPRFQALLEQRAAAYVVRQSNPRHIRLRTVVDLRAKRQPNERLLTNEREGLVPVDGKTRVRGPIRPTRRSIKSPPPMPFTLKKLADPDGIARHGHIIYVFRHIKTNQIIYSLQELLDKHHLRQITFIGKGTKPPVVRPDHWVPHCIVNFPHPEQGLNAFRKLREFRKLHEMAWSKSNPEFRSLTPRKRMETIMDQRANMSADLAAVLRTQEKQGKIMAKAMQEYEKKTAAFLKERWALTNNKESSENPESKPKSAKRLRFRLQVRNNELEMKKFQNEADQKRLKRSIQDIKKSLKIIERAAKRLQEKDEHENLSIHIAALAEEKGVNTQRLGLRRTVRRLEKAIKEPKTDLSEELLAENKISLASHKADLAAIERPLEVQAKERQLLKRRSILPPALKKSPPTPYILTGLRIQWRELRDALYAANQWPQTIEHEAMALHKWRDESALVSAEEFDQQADEEISSLIVGLRTNTISQSNPRNIAFEEPEFEEEPEKRTGVLKYLPKIRMPWSSTTA